MVEFPMKSILRDIAGVTTNSATATNFVSLYELRGIHCIKLILNPNLLGRIYLGGC